MNILAWFIKRDPRTSAILAAFIFLASTLHINNNLINAETGEGSDIFRVIMTVFGVENTKGDIVAIVSVNNGDSSKVKFLETEAFEPVSSNLTSLVITPNPDSNAGIMEYVATFPNVTVNAGDEYKACVMTTKDLELLCKTGHNSPASRPEFIDINLDEVTASGTEQLETEEQQALLDEQD